MNDFYIEGEKNKINTITTKKLPSYTFVNSTKKNIYFVQTSCADVDTDKTHNKLSSINVCGC